MGKMLLGMINDNNNNKKTLLFISITRDFDMRI